MVYIGQRAAHLITGCVVCVFIPLLWEVLQAWLSRCLPLGCVLPTCTFTHPTAHRCPCTLCPPQTCEGLDPSSPGARGGGRRRLRARRQGNQQDLYLEQECRKCGNNWGVRAGGFQSPEVTKGFHPGSVGRGGRRWAADSDGRL